MRFLTAQVKAADDRGAGTFEAVASMPTVDRDGEVIVAGAFNPLPASVKIHVDHDMSTTGLVGTARPYYVGDKLMVKGRFASTPKAQIIRQLVVEGHLDAMSVGFMAARRDPNDKKRIVKAELLEVSFVTVPSNREALVLSAKSALAESSIVAKVREIVAEVERVCGPLSPPALNEKMLRISPAAAVTVFLAETEQYHENRRGSR